MIFFNSSYNLQKNQKLNQKFPPKWPQKWKVDIKMIILKKNGKFRKYLDNLEKIKNLPKNSPQMISKLKNLHQKWKFWKKNENLKKNENFKIFRKSRKKWKIAPKIQRNDHPMSPKCLNWKKYFFLNFSKVSY